MIFSNQWNMEETETCLCLAFTFVRVKGVKIIAGEIITDSVIYTLTNAYRRKINSTFSADIEKIERDKCIIYLRWRISFI